MKSESRSRAVLCNVVVLLLLCVVVCGCCKEDLRLVVVEALDQCSYEGLLKAWIKKKLICKLHDVIVVILCFLLLLCIMKTNCIFLNTTTNADVSWEGSNCFNNIQMLPLHFSSER